MAVITKNQLLEAGVHFGHNTRRWNPKMKEYIFGERNSIYIIDLDKTVTKVEEAYKALFTIVQNNGTVLFVGTRKQTQDVIKEEAIRSESYYVDQRWLGGTLTNNKTIRRSIAKLQDIEKMEEEGTFEVLPKKEVASILKEKERLVKCFSGIKNMTQLPDAMVVVDPKTEHNAVAEARRLHIPIFGLVDTNCDPDDVDYVIPANDDAIRSVKLIVATLANAVVEAKGGTPIVIEFTDEPQPEERPTNRRANNNRRGANEHQRREAKPRQPRPERKAKEDKEEVKAEEANEEVKEVVKETPAQEAPVEEVKEDVAEEAVEVKEEQVEENNENKEN